MYAKSLYICGSGVLQCIGMGVCGMWVWEYRIVPCPPLPGADNVLRGAIGEETAVPEDSTGM